MLKFRKIKAFAFVEALLALMIATLTVLLLSFVLGDSVKREQQHKCVLNEYSNQLMKLHESRLPVSYTEDKTSSTTSTSKIDDTNAANKNTHKTKEVIRLKKINSTSVRISCDQEEVVQIERMDSSKKVSVSTN